MTLRVLVVGPAPAGAASRGGMATVIALMAAHPDERIRITTVPTYIEGSRWQRLATSVYGMLRATWLVLSGGTDILHVHLAHGGSVDVLVVAGDASNVEDDREGLDLLA